MHGRPQEDPSNVKKKAATPTKARPAKPGEKDKLAAAATAKTASRKDAAAGGRAATRGNTKDSKKGIATVKVTKAPKTNTKIATRDKNVKNTVKQKPAPASKAKKPAEKVAVTARTSQTADRKTVGKKVIPSPKAEDIRTPMKKPDDRKTGRKTNAAVAPAGKKKKGGMSAIKARSQHLQKLLALREETRKIKKPEEIRGGASEATVKINGVAAQGKAAEEKPKKRKRRKSPYSRPELRELRRLLEDERERLIRDLRQLDDLADSNRQTTHATFSSHQADAASDSAAMESTFIQRRYEEERFAWVSEALLKLENGSYGLCDLCADEPADLCATCPFIPVDRLRAKPHAKMCVQLRSQMEKRNKR